jgi:hypothetical protein
MVAVLIWREEQKSPVKDGAKGLLVERVGNPVRQRGIILPANRSLYINSVLAGTGCNALP